MNLSIMAGKDSRILHYPGIEHRQFCELRVTQNPSGKVIFVNKSPPKPIAAPKKNLNGQITVLSIFRLFYFFQRTKLSSTDIFFQNVF